MAYAVTGAVADVAHMGNSVVLFNAEIRLKTWQRKQASRKCGAFKTPHCGGWFWGFSEIQNSSSAFGLQGWQAGMPLLRLDMYRAMFCDSARNKFTQWPQMRHKVLLECRAFLCYYGGNTLTNLPRIPPPRSFFCGRGTLVTKTHFWTSTPLYQLRGLGGRRKELTHNHEMAL